MRQVFHSSWRNCLWGARCGSQAVRILLTALALLQGGIVLFVVIGKEVPVPAPLGQLILDRLIDEHWSAEWRELELDLLGGVRAKNLRIYDDVTGTWILDIENIWLDLDFWEILTGRGPGLNRLYISNARMNAPAMYTRSGVDERLIDQIATEIEMGGDWIQFHHLQFRIGGHNVILSSPDRLEMDWTGETHDLNLPSYLRQLVVRIQRAADRAPQMSPARIIGQIRSTPENGWKLDASLAVNRIDLPSGYGSAHNAELIFEGVEWPDELVTGSLRMRAGWVGIESPALEMSAISLYLPRFRFESREHWAVENLQAELRKIETPWVNLKQIGTLLSIDSERLAPSGEIRAVYNNSPFQVQFADLQPDLSGLVQVQAELNDLPSVLAQFMEPEWIGFVPVTKSPIRLKADLRLDPGGVPESAHWQANLASVQYRETLIPFVRAKGVSNHARTEIEPADVWISPDEQVRLQYHQHYPNPVFLLTAIGHSRQPLLNPILDFDWWWQIWEFVTPGEKPVFADVRVAGIWGQENQVQSWVGIAADEGFFRELPLKRLDLSIAQQPGQVDLYRLDGETAGGQFSGSLHWRQPDPGQGNPNDQFFRVKGQMPVQELRQFAGEGFDWIEEIRSDAAPEVDFYLERKQASIAEDHQEAVVKVHHPADVEIFGLPVSNLKTLARHSPGKLKLNSTHLSFMDGSVWLDLSIDELGSEFPSFATRIRARGVEHESMLNLFRGQFLDWEESELIAVGDKPGKHDSDLRLRGRFGETNSYQGSGRNRITEAELGKVRLFGELSRALEAVGLPFTSLQLETAEAHWTLADGKLKLPAVRVDGPSIRLSAHGEVGIPDTDLDFVVQAFVIRGLFGLVLRPMNLVLEFRLGGQLDDPSWGLRINPFRWLGTGTGP